MNAKNAARVEMAFQTARSLVASNFNTFDAIDSAMNQFGLNYEDGFADIFDHIAYFLGNS